MARGREQRLVHHERYLERMSEDIQSAEFGYDYPYGKDLRPGTVTHDRIVQLVNDCLQGSREWFSPALADMERMDWSLRAYTPLDDLEEATQADDSRRPVGVIVPVTYGALETLMTYMSAAFYDYPIHRLVGRGTPQDMVDAALIERLLQRQGQWFKEPLHLNTLFRDAFTYGIGIASPVWRKRRVRRKVTEEVSELLGEFLNELNLDISSGDMVTYLEQQTLYEGNKIEVWDPYNVILDPNATVNDIQDAEYIGFQRRSHVMDILERETDPEERLFNGKYCQLLVNGNLGQSVWFNDHEHGRNTRQGLEGMSPNEPPKSHSMDYTYVVANIIPAEWNLSDETDPEKWEFCVVGDEILVQCNPLDLDHGMFPAVALAPNTGGHDMMPVSHLAITYGLQTTIDWFMRAKIDSVCKVVNGQLVFDPTMIEAEDMLNPKMGGLIRLKRSSYGQMNLDGMIKQLEVRDVTANHPADIAFLMGILEKALGTTDIMQGILAKMPERPTATGIQAATTGGLSRLQYITKMVGLQAVDPLTFQMVYNTVQFMERDVAVSILGRYEETLRREFNVPQGEDQVNVTPFLRMPNFEVESHDGSLPHAQDKQALTSILQAMMSVPGVGETLAQETDVLGLFIRWARAIGLQNPQQWLGNARPARAQVMPDEQVQQQVQAGNLVPLQTGGAYG